MNAQPEMSSQGLLRPQVCSAWHLLPRSHPCLKHMLTTPHTSLRLTYILGIAVTSPAWSRCQHGHLLLNFK